VVEHKIYNKNNVFMSLEGVLYWMEVLSSFGSQQHEGRNVYVGVL